MTNLVIRIAGALATGTFGFGLLVTGAQAADIDAGCIPAVSTTNAKLEGAGGYYKDQKSSGGRFQGIASVSLPIGCLVGAQIDLGGGDLDGTGFFGVGGHLFTRDPSSYLFGLQAQYVELGHRSIFRIGPEAEFYLGDVTLSAMAGFEDARRLRSDDIVAQVEAAYYIDDNFKIYGGFRHFLPIDAGAIGFEFKPESLPASFFVDAMAGSQHYVSVMGGLRFEIGATDKTLKARQREDDPGHYFNLLARPAEPCVPVAADGAGVDCGPIAKELQVPNNNQ
jgi:hypothetical protein